MPKPPPENQVPCLRCGARAGEWCVVTTTGLLAQWPHVIRKYALDRAEGYSRYIPPKARALLEAAEARDGV